ncbi:MAG: T9SS type A sorting domain-containing protein [Melioribacteraceae bacterium]|nr:T9SS type A sorting domain-containing protein [Melioribacteraceae bacterium]
MNDVSYLNFRIEYDTTKITFDRVDVVSELDDAGYFTSSVKNGIISAIWLASTPVDCHGELFHLFFNYDETSVANLHFISGKAQNSNRDNLGIQLNDGSVSPMPISITIPVVVNPSGNNSIPIQFGTLESIGTMNLEIQYDEESVTLNDVSVNLPSLSSFTYSANSGILKIDWTGAAIQNVSGDLFEMNFAYNPNAEPANNLFSEIRIVEAAILDEQNELVDVIGLNGCMSQNTEPAVKLFAPNGGEVWNSVSNTEKIEWGSVFLNTVSIYLSTDDGLSWVLVDSSVNVAKGFDDWTIPNVSSDQCKMKIISDEENEVFDISENTFSIQVVSGVEEERLPTEFNVDQNFPNPFNPSTKIRYALPVQSKVNLTIYNLLGQKVETLVNEVRPAGFHEIVWYAGNYANGIYFFRIIASDYIKTKKMILLK